MKLNLLLLLGFFSMLLSCKSDAPSTEENQEIVRLRNEIRQLEMQNSEKDLLIDESLSLFNEIQENISKRREFNFIGEILKHHTLSSTKFMSKWIEEKNKK